MSDPFFEIQQEHVFTLRMDIAGLAALEKGMAFYSERAILQDGDPARDLARTLTSMLMKLAVTRHAVETPEAAILPPERVDVLEVADPVADVEAELRRRLAEHERNSPVEGSQTVGGDDGRQEGIEDPNEAELQRQARVAAADEGFVTDEENEEAIGNLGTEHMVEEDAEPISTEVEAVEGSQTVGDPDDPLAQQLDAMIGD